MVLSVETLFPSPKETTCDKHLWEARDFSRVRLHISDDLFSLQKDRITTEKLGRAFEPEDLYEDPNGDPIRLDTDFCENEWGEKVFSGPFSRSVERIVISKVF